MEQKHINVIRTCLKIMRASGNDKSKADIEEALKAFDKETDNSFKGKSDSKFKLIEYFEEKGTIKWHIVDFAESEEEINIKKKKIADELNNAGIETLEILATKNINCMKEILRRSNLKIFQVIRA